MDACHGGFPDSLGGQDSWFSPSRPGFDSRSGSIFIFRCRSFLFKNERETKNWGRAGIEPATSRTRSENHTSRPTAVRSSVTDRTPHTGLDGRFKQERKKKQKSKICRHLRSNQGPSDLQSDALPTEL